MNNQSPQQCKDTDATKWMYNDQDQTPCQVLSSSIHQFDTSYNLSWLDLSLTCPHASNHTNNTTFLSHQLSEFCCSSVSFSLFSSCWACQWDQPVDGFLHTTWSNYSSTCSTNGTTGAIAVARIGSLSTSVQSALTAANIHIPTWAFLPVVGNQIWNETAAKANATLNVAPTSMEQQQAPNALSAGAIAGISIGSFIIFCVALFAFTVICMRKKQRHRLEAFRHRSASIFGHKKRVVNMGEKAVAPRNRGQRGEARMDLALEDDGLASPVSVKGGFSGARRVNSDLTMDISHEGVIPTLLGGHGAGLGAPASGVAGVPQQQQQQQQRQRPESGPGVGARILARLQRLSQPGRANSPKAQGLTDAPTTTTTSNRHTHPMTQSSFPTRDSAPFAVPFSSLDSVNIYGTTRPTLNASTSAPPSSWPTTTFDTSAAHPLTQQQLHPQLSRNAPSPGAALQLSTADKPTPMPLTKESLALARVAQDGTLFVLGDEAVNRGNGKLRGPGGRTGSRPAQQQQQQQQQQQAVHTVSIVRNPAQMNRHVEMLPRRSDSLRRSELLAAQEQDHQTQAQPQLGLVLHESIMDGTVPRRKTPSRQRDREGLGAPVASTSRASPGTEMGLGTTSASRPSGTAAPRGDRQRSISTGALAAPVARKAVPKSDSSVKANAGSAVGSNGETFGEDDDDSLAALEIQFITGSATGTSGSISGSTSNGNNASGNGNGNGNGRGGRGSRGKKRGRSNDDLRLSVAANTIFSSGGMSGVKSDGTRTPSPKVAPSAEWFDLFRRGNVPTFAGLDWVKKDSPIPEADSRAKPDLSRNKTARAAASSGLPAAATSTPGAGPSGTAHTMVAEAPRKKPTFQPNAQAGPSMAADERQRTYSNNARGSSEATSSFYRTPVADMYSSSFPTGPASTAPGASGSSTGNLRRQHSAQNATEIPSAPTITIPTSASMSTAPHQPSIIRALPTISAPPASVLPVSVATNSSAPLDQMISLPSALGLHNAVQALPTQPHQQRPPPSAPLPIPPTVAPATTYLPPQPRVAPAGARPVRRLPTIPPQSPTG